MDLNLTQTLLANLIILEKKPEHVLRAINNKTIELERNHKIKTILNKMKRLGQPKGIIARKN